MPNNEIEFVRNNRIAEEVVLVDGPARSGKSMLGPILSSFARVEIERMEPFFDSFPLLYSFKKITKDAAISLLRREVDVRLYDSMVSRMINFRIRDRTSVFNSPNSFRYIKRMFLKDGDIVLDRIKKEKPIFQVMTHDNLQNLDLFLEAFGDGLRVIEMVRHPVDLVYSMNNRGYGNYLALNPRYWEIGIKGNGGDFPYYANGWIDKYLKYSPIDRVINRVKLNAKQVSDKYDSFPQSLKRQIFFISFEDFKNNTYKYLELIENFISSKVTKHTRKVLKKLKFPTQIDPEMRKNRMKLIKERASKECLQILDDLVEEYECKYFNH